MYILYLECFKIIHKFNIIYFQHTTTILSPFHYLEAIRTCFFLYCQNIIYLLLHKLDNIYVNATLKVTQISIQLKNKKKKTVFFFVKTKSHCFATFAWTCIRERTMSHLNYYVVVCGKTPGRQFDCRGCTRFPWERHHTIGQTISHRARRVHWAVFGESVTRLGCLRCAGGGLEEEFLDFFVFAIPTRDISRCIKLYSCFFVLKYFYKHSPICQKKKKLLCMNLEKKREGGNKIRKKKKLGTHLAAGGQVVRGSINLASRFKQSTTRYISKRGAKPKIFTARLTRCTLTSRSSVTRGSAIHRKTTISSVLTMVRPATID